jgi:hypothetical protein
MLELNEALPQSPVPAAETVQPPEPAEHSRHLRRFAVWAGSSALSISVLLAGAGASIGQATEHNPDPLFLLEMAREQNRACLNPTEALAAYQNRRPLESGQLHFVGQEQLDEAYRAIDTATDKAGISDALRHYLEPLGVKLAVDSRPAGRPGKHPQAFTFTDPISLDDLREESRLLTAYFRGVPAEWTRLANIELYLGSGLKKQGNEQAQTEQIDGLTLTDRYSRTPVALDSAALRINPAATAEQTPISFQQVVTEELFHALDRRLSGYGRSGLEVEHSLPPEVFMSPGVKDPAARQRLVQQGYFASPRGSYNPGEAVGTTAAFFLYPDGLPADNDTRPVAQIARIIAGNLEHQVSGSAEYLNQLHANTNA